MRRQLARRARSHPVASEVPALDCGEAGAFFVERAAHAEPSRYITVDAASAPPTSEAGVGKFPENESSVPRNSHDDVLISALERLRETFRRDLQPYRARVAAQAICLVLCGKTDDINAGLWPKIVSLLETSRVSIVDGKPNETCL